MSIGLTLVFLTLLQVYYGILALKFITGAGYKSWQALLPFYNIYIMTKVIKRPWWWTALAILPVVGNVMMAVIFFELLHMYRIADVKNTVIGILSAGLYFGYLGYSSVLKYQDRDLKIIRKYISEGFASIVFAVIAATLIRAYTFEAFTIPTPSMERSMMVGDFLFVSKLQYGSRLPMTPFSFPLMHNKVPFTEIKAFSGAVQFPYLRLPKLSDVERNDPVVFNYPRQLEYPVDKRDHYVKRCLGLPGDTLEIKNLKVYVNGSLSQMPERADAQFQYYVRTKNGRLGAALELKERYDINPIESGDYYEIGEAPGYAEYLITISESEIEKFKQDYPQIDTIFPLDLSRESVKNLPNSLKRHGQSIVSGGVFPNSVMMDYGKASGIGTNWTRDNFGPIHIPKANTTVDLTINNYKLYKAIIEDYEGHDLKVIRPSKGSPNHEFQIDGELVNSYTFEQDYYWMMGDNRHNSEDSRYWGFVPEDHIVGKPVFIWMSFDKYGSSLFEKIRFDRVFTTVSGDGERRSYFWPFMVVVVGITIFNRWRKKKKSDHGIMQSGRFGLYYWGPVSYYARLIRYPNLYFETHDNFVKQSYRNRCYIDSPNGELRLNIPIDHQHKGKMLETRYNRKDPWRQKHWQALLTSYNSSPFFDALAPELQAFYKRDYPSLAVLNFETTKIILQWLRYDGSFSLSSSYDLNTQLEDDYRDAFDAKGRDQKKIAPYVQVFDHKSGFKPELSILDLIFNEGPATWDYLQQL